MNVVRSSSGSPAAVDKGLLGPLPPELVLEMLGHMPSADVGTFARTSRDNCELALRELRVRYFATPSPHCTIDAHKRGDLLRYRGQVRRINGILNRPERAGPPPLESLWTSARDMVIDCGALQPPTPQCLRDNMFLFDMASYRPLPLAAQAWGTLALAYLGHNERAMATLRAIPRDCTQLRELVIINIANGALERDDVRLFARAHAINPMVCTWLTEAVRRGRLKIARFCWNQGARPATA